MESLNMKEARELLIDFFDIHSLASNGQMMNCADRIMKGVPAEKGIELKTVPALRMGSVVLNYFPDGYNPKTLFLVWGGGNNIRKMVIK